MSIRSWIRDKLEDFGEWIYDHLESYSATLIFLSAMGHEITEEHLDIIGDTEAVLPVLDYEWMEILLTFYLFGDPDNFGAYEEHQQQLIQRLQRNGALERRYLWSIPAIRTTAIFYIIRKQKRN